MHIVNIEFGRIQSFLFASSRLKAILGANSLLGKTIRVDLVALAQECGAIADPEIVQLLPVADAKDPLSIALSDPVNELLRDDPQNLYRDTGVMIRDGGHFRATFKDPVKANDFVKRALDCIALELPGLSAGCWIDGEAVAGGRGSREISYGHPVWQICQEKGDRPASKKDRKGKKDRWISEDEHDLEERGQNFRDDPCDLIGILDSGATRQTLDEISATGYLALIHADGNSVGKRFGAWRDQGKESGLHAEAHAETFYHSMRVAVRKALIAALQTTFTKTSECTSQPRPYQLLMLGGDDLLLACSAEYAFPFITAYAEALTQHKLVDGEPLSIGTGIAIAKAKFPFHRLHQAAETLASSAKQLYRAHPELGSVVDWHISSQSWLEDPLAERISLYAGKPLIGIARPYPINKERPPLPSLQTLLSRVSKAQAGQLARSQLRAFLETLHQGDLAATELAWYEMPQQLRTDLADGGVNWRDHRAGVSGHAPHLSTVGDFIDLIEVAYLGRRAEGSAV